MNPPRLATRLLRSFLREDLAEEVSGDLEEKFYKTINKKGKFRAKVNYWFQVTRYIRPFAIRKSTNTSNYQSAMLKNYLKIGMRNLLKAKGYSFINIGGLAAGMAVATLIGLWVHDELSFNRYHESMPRIGQIMRNGTMNGVTGTTPYLPFPLAEELRTKHGENFKHVVAIWPSGDQIITAGDKLVSKMGQYIDKGGPEMFTLKMTQGSWEGLADPHSVFLSASLAKALYGDQDPMGQAMRLGGRMDVKVTGVYEDLPHNTHFYGIELFAPMELLVSVNPWVLEQGFKNNFLNVFVELQPNLDFKTASERISQVIVNQIKDSPDYVKVNPEIFLHPMEDWHLRSEFENGINAGGTIRFVWLFSIVGVFVLFLACINFMNLSTARSEHRAKEIGIRKAIGSVRRQLINQFFTESFLVVFLSFIVALLVTALSLPWFNQLSGKQMTMFWSEPYFWLACAAFILLTGLVAGSYPALYLSSFSPVTVLKGAFRRGRFAAVPRKIMVVVQFTVSVTLIIGTIIVEKQIMFAKDRPVGYDREGLLLIQLSSSDYNNKLETLETELKNTGVVKDVATSLSPTTGIWSTNGGFNWRGKSPDLQAEFGTLDVSHDYGKTIGWHFVDGRDFSRDLASDSTGLIINETAAKLLGFENPIGEIVSWAPPWRAGISFTIIGVVDDLVMRSPYEEPMPTLFYMGGRINWLNIRLDNNVSLAEALPKVESAFKKVVPSVPFQYKFADDEYALKFAAEERIGQLATAFAVLAIFISCLGLFGLASFVAEQRTKEIGIRKVVGASIFNLWKLLSTDFVVLVMISSLLAVPIAWYFLAGWLQEYDYHTNISWWIFASAILGAMALTLITVSFQAIRAALMNPVRSLRSE